MPGLSDFTLVHYIIAGILLFLFLFSLLLFIFVLLYLRYQKKSPALPAQPKPKEKQEVDMDSYIENVSQRVGTQWQKTTENKVKTDEEFEISARFHIDRSGKVKDAEITHSSDNEELDQIVIDAILGIEGIPPLPEGYELDTLELEMTFQNM
jgi:TonB family protein